MRLSHTHGYVGMYVVSKEYRGLGIGKQVWNAAIGHLGSRNNGLSAVAHLFTLYRDKAGFEHVTDWTVDLYKLDNLAVFYHCQQLTSFHHYKRGRMCKMNHSLLEYYKENADLMLMPGSESQMLAYLESDYDTFEYQDTQFAMEASFEISDDESYGFSTLFLEQSQEVNREEVIEQSEAELNQPTTEGIEVANDTFNCCLQYYCSSHLNGKLRTVLVKPDNEQLTNEVVDYDHRLHQYDRSKIVRLTLKEKGCISRVAMLGEALVGYGCIKPNLQQMWIVSPLYADNEYVAQLLMLDLISDVVFVSQLNLQPETRPSIVLKAPSNNHHASNLLVNIGFVKQDYSLRRCYTKCIFEVPTQSIYALHTSVFCTE